MGFLNGLFNFVGKAFGGLGQAAQGAGQTIGKVASQAIPGILQSGAQGFGNIMNAFKSPSSQAAAGLAPRAPANYYLTQGKSPMSSMAGPVQSSITANAPTGSASFLKKGFGNLINQFGSQGYQDLMPKRSESGTPEAKQGWAQKLWGGDLNPLQIGAGVGINALGGMMAPKADVGKLDFGNLASVQALNNFQPGKTGPLPPEVEAAINRNLQQSEDQELKQLRDVYKNARPGTDYTTDSAYQRDLANMQREQGLRRADAIANTYFDNMRIQLGANQEEMEKLTEVANLDIAGIMARLGMEAQEAEQFKQSFSNIGSMFLQKGFNIQPSGGDVLSQFLTSRLAGVS